MQDAQRAARHPFRYRDDVIELSKVGTLLPKKDAKGNDVSEYEVMELAENDAVLAEVSEAVLTGKLDDTGRDAYEFLIGYKYENIKLVTMKNGRQKWIDPNEHESIRMALDSLCNKAYIGGGKK